MVLKVLRTILINLIVYLGRGFFLCKDNRTLNFNYKCIIQIYCVSFSDKNNLLMHAAVPKI